MTIDEAITIIKAYRERLTESVSTLLDGDIEAFDIAIEAMEREQKTGHWTYFKAVNTSEIIWSECSECKEGEIGCAKRMKYCPNCGCRMVESQESEG